LSPLRIPDPPGLASLGRAQTSRAKASEPSRVHGSTKSIRRRAKPAQAKTICKTGKYPFHFTGIATGTAGSRVPTCTGSVQAGIKRSITISTAKTGFEANTIN